MTTTGVSAAISLIQCSRRCHVQAVYDNHRQEFVMSRAKVNYQRVNMALEGFRRMLVSN